MYKDKAQFALQPKPKIRQPKNFRKVEIASGNSKKCDNFWVALPKYKNRSK